MMPCPDDELLWNFDTNYAFNFYIVLLTKKGAQTQVKVETAPR